MSEEQAPKKRNRKTYAQRKAELKEQLAKLEAQAAKKQMEEAIANGECHDPERAKELNKEIRYLAAARGTMLKYNLTTEDAYAKVTDALSNALEAAVNGPE